MTLRHSALLLLVFGFLAALPAQIISPVSWETSIKPLGNDAFELQVIARMEDGWAVYSQFTPEGGPEPLLLEWTTGPHYELVGQTTETGHRKDGMDEIFGVEVIKFLSDEDLLLSQQVKVLDYAKPIELLLVFMACDELRCLPPTEELFVFQLPAPAPAGGATNPRGTTEKVDDMKAATEPVSPQKPAQDGIIERTEEKLEQQVRQQTEARANNEVSMGEEDFQPAVFSISEPPATESDPVTWRLDVEQVGALEYVIKASAVIEPEWTLYGHLLDPEIGPVPTALVLEEVDLQLVGQVEQLAENRKVVFEDVWDAEVPKLYDGVVYTQRIRVNADTEQINGTITYMACKEVCLPPEDLPFSLNLKNQTASIGYDGGIAAPAPGEGPQLATVGGTDCGLDFNNVPLANCSEGVAEVKGKGFLAIFGLGFLGGIFALIMPCIFPMIPLTVNYFNKGGKDRKKGIRQAGLYGFFIFAIYVLLSVPFHLVEGVDANILNDVASNVPLNIFFFAVFMFFAGSFFGYYELTLPASWTNTSSKAEGSGGVIGIFFMALTLALVSFSCTGPILGSLLVGTASEGAMPLTAGMAGFGLALALPFTLFAAFPQLLQSLPSSGGWLNSVKVVLGFVEVALAFKFLSNADLVGEWNLLKIEPFYIIWILCALGITAYLFRLISFPHDSKNRKIGVFGSLVAVASLVFAGYLFTGFQVDKEIGSYKPLSLLSGIAPSVCYSFWNPCDCPQGIPCFKDLDEGLAYACKENKPVMLDFTGYTCTNCREMEENVWSKDQIRSRLSNDYVLISLYVDDRTKLPKDKQREVERPDRPGQMKLIDQVGEQWHHLQQSVYQHSTQPYYVLISPDGKMLNPPVSFTEDVDDYQQFLDCGLSTYEALTEDRLETETVPRIGSNTEE